VQIFSLRADACLHDRHLGAQFRQQSLVLAQIVCAGVPMTLALLLAAPAGQGADLRQAVARVH